MLRNKRILLLLITIALLFILPSICNAAETNAIETTTTSTGKTVKWSYELEGDSIVNLKCINVSEISGVVTIPETIDGHTVVSIGHTESYDHYDGVFEGCNGITGITIPNTVTTIGREAFRGCVGLKNVTIPNSVTSIGFNAFYGCTGITSITLSENLSIIGSEAFYGCTGLKTITLPNSLTTISSRAFYGCTGLKSVIIPNNVTSLGEYSFYSCTGLTNVTLSQNLTKINRSTFQGCTGLTSVIIPESVTTIDGYDGNIYGAFQDCTRLEKVLIPDSVATILKSAFRNCPKLTIYGNDGQTSKQYAEDNEINFDYIVNWDKVAEGSDITPLKVKSLEIAYSSIFKYDSGTGYYLASAGTNISIKATFEEIIHGTTAPKLTIRCGNGANIELTNGVIQSSNIVYTYQIKEQDKGIISAVSMTGGDIKDEAGNKAEEYTCPEVVTDVWQRYVYANGTGSTTGNQGNNGNNNTTVTLSSISITTSPTKATYTEGEKFDKTGMVITATYSDGTTKNITNYTISPSETLKTTDKKVVISYTENGVTKTAEQVIKVNSKTSGVTLSSIKITKAPTKTKYTEGEKFNKNGMIITATYSDGTTKEITNYSVSPSKELKTTDKKVTITYTENEVTKTVQQTISVEKDSTTKKDDKIPQTGVAVLSVALISLIAVAVISKVKYGAYKDI